MTDAIPAATLVLFRETGGAPEILMVQRAATMVFAGGAMVFPGGRVDPADYALAALHAPTLDDAAERIAAIRETLEEAGIAVGIDPLPAAADIPAIRAALHAGATLAEAIGDRALSLDVLEPFARWLPAHRHMRIFDTRFYLARLPEDAAEAQVDATENTRLAWASAAEVLAAADRGEAHIIYPTRRNLERLARFETYDAAVADARAHPIRPITPFVEEREGQEHLCIPADAGYPVTAEPMTAAVRG